jgi:hypothetical protein
VKRFHSSTIELHHDPGAAKPRQRFLPELTDELAGQHRPTKDHAAILNQLARRLIAPCLVRVYVPSRDFTGLLLPQGRKLTRSLENLLLALGDGLTATCAEGVFRLEDGRVARESVTILESHISRTPVTRAARDACAQLARLASTHQQESLAVSVGDELFLIPGSANRSASKSRRVVLGDLCGGA